MTQWIEYKIFEICDKITDGSHYSPKLSKDGKRLIATVKDMTENSFKYRKCKRISEDEYKKLVVNGCKAEKEDVLLSKDGTMGLVQLFKDDIDLVLLSSIAILKAKKSIILPIFLTYLLKSPGLQNEIKENFKTGSALPRITLKDLKLIPVKIPTNLSEQKEIASILSCLDDKIDLLHRQNKTLEAIAETLFRQWCIEESEDDWEEKSLNDIADYLNGLALQKYPVNGLNILPVIKIREMKQGISENTEKCSGEIPQKYIIKDGDILFSWSGSLEIVIWHDGEGALNQHLFKVSSSKYPKWFYYFATKHYLSFFRMIAATKSTTMGHIQRNHLDEAKINIPDEKSFYQYNEIINPLFEKIIKNNKQIRTLTQLRDTLLPNLMSGEVRVKI